MESVRFFAALRNSSATTAAGRSDRRPRSRGWIKSKLSGGLVSLHSSQSRSVNNAPTSSRTAPASVRAVGFDSPHCGPHDQQATRPLFNLSFRRARRKALSSTKKSLPVWSSAVPVPGVASRQRGADGVYGAGTVSSRIARTGRRLQVFVQGRIRECCDIRPLAP